MNRRSSACWLALLFALAGMPDVSVKAAAEAKRPNVLFILTDDQGWGDAHFAGHPCVKTPNLDRFASQSTWFKQFYVAATVCSPSRCAFMTSHYPARHQIHGHFADHALNQARSMPDWPDLQFLLGFALSRLNHQRAGYGERHRRRVEAIVHQTLRDVLESTFALSLNFFGFRMNS